MVPLLGDTTNDTRRRGAAEACYHIVDRLKLDIIPYIVILVIPIMGRMSDFDVQVRQGMISCEADMRLRGRALKSRCRRI